MSLAWYKWYRVYLVSYFCEMIIRMKDNDKFNTFTNNIKLNNDYNNSKPVFVLLLCCVRRHILFQFSSFHLSLFLLKSCLFCDFNNISIIAFAVSFIYSSFVCKWYLDSSFVCKWYLVFQCHLQHPLIVLNFYTHTVV